MQTMHIFGLNKIQIKNLTTLRDMMRTNQKNIVLDMRAFSNDCGTAMCSVGYAAHWGIGDSERYRNKEYKITDYDYHANAFDYNTYSRNELSLLTFEIEYKYLDNIGKMRFDVWRFLFSAFHNNSIESVIERLTIVINGDIESLLNHEYIEEYIVIKLYFTSYKDGFFDYKELPYSYSAGKFLRTFVLCGVRKIYYCTNAKM